MRRAPVGLVLAVSLLAGCEARTYLVPTTGMAPTIPMDTRITVVPYGGPVQEEIRRGDIVAAYLPSTYRSMGVKRVIALPGDSIEIQRGVVYLNGERLEEPYRMPVKSTGMFSGLPSLNEIPAVQVPPGEVFLLGDNRGASVDSRTFGCVAMSRISGRVRLAE
jgi:signal peptidase I